MYLKRRDTVRGVWWVPGVNVEVSGQLTMDEHGGIELLLEKLSTEWLGLSSTPTDRVAQIPMLHGRVDSVPSEFSFVNCTVFATDFLLPKSFLLDYEVRCEFAIEGILLEPDKSNSFSRIAFPLSHLYVLSGRSGMGLGSREDPPEGEERILATYRKAADLSVQFDNKTVSLRTGYSSKARRTAVGTTLTYTETSHFDLEFELAQTLTGLTAHVRCLQDLVSFISGSSAGLERVVLPGVNPGHEVRMHFSAPGLYDLEAPRPSATSLNRIPDIAFDALVPAWYQVFEQLGSVVQYLLSRIHYAPQGHLIAKSSASLPPPNRPTVCWAWRKSGGVTQSIRRL
jgi:hypothetical protein